jgi:hypothetical protein
VTRSHGTRKRSWNRKEGKRRGNTDGPFSGRPTSCTRRPDRYNRTVENAGLPQCANALSTRIDSNNCSE